MRTHRITMFGFCVLAGVACGSTGRQGSTLEQDAAASAGESASSGGGLGSSASVTNASGDGGTSGGVLADAPAETPDGGGSAESGPCSDSCPQPNGLTVGCETRFLYGVNYAWKNWVADFGGVSVWGQKGVSQNQSAIMPDLMDMQANGVDVIRWWMLQKLEGDAITFDSSDTPTGTGGTLVADIQAALLLATTVGVHYNFTIFSFDDFAPSGSDKGATIHGMADIITDATKRAALMNVVKTIARTVEASPQKDRVVSWDVINEPE